MDLGPRYRCLRELGRGGMGRVFLVRDGYLGKDLALKLLAELTAEAGDIERLQREFALLAQIEHPGIARVHDFGYLRGRPYFTSEYIPGRPLADRVPVRDPRELLAMAADLAGAAAFLHRHEILHLDIKPANVIVPERKQPVRAVLIDFGLVRRGFSGPPGFSLRGSLPFMAPEYFRGGPLGPWTDVYALGITLYRAATGAYPRFEPGAKEASLFDEAAWEPLPRPPARLSPGLPRDLESIILKCLALDPRLRFPSAAELLEALRRLRGQAAPGAAPAALAARTVGRDRELEAVDRFLDGLFKEGGGQAALLITGPPGMGQSHLFREIKVRAQTRGIRCYLEVGYPGRTVAPGSLLRCLEAHLQDGPVRRGRGDSGKGRVRSRWRAFLIRLRRPRRSPQCDTLDGERRLRRATEVALAASAVCEPFLLAIDGLHHWDEISVELLLDLVRHLEEKPPAERPPIAVIAGYREEGPAVALLRELSRVLLEGKRTPVVTLGPLGLEETLDLRRRLGGGGVDGSGSLEVFQETGGCPARIAALAAPRAPLLPAADAGGGGGEPTRGVGPQGRRLLLALELLGRPAEVEELSRFSGAPRRRLQDLLAELRAAGLVSEGEPDAGRRGWLAEPAAAGVTAGAGEAERREIHRRLARELVRMAAAEDDPRRLEAARHFQAAGDAAGLARHGLPAARYLKSTFQNRAALEIFGAVLDHLPSDRRRERLDIALEMADLHARAGSLDVGIRLLRELLVRARGLPAPAREKVLLRLASLYSRRGDFRRAEALFRDRLPGLRRRAARRSSAPVREEFLNFLNEQAAVKAFLGKYREAARLCAEGLRTTKRSRAARVLELAVNLHATAASIALRNFDYDAAARSFEASLELAEAIGSLGNQAVILNNLGILYGQCDRYEDATRAFREAEKTCLRIDEGPSLASIHGNLAVLHAKTGRFEEMEKALGEGERLRPGAVGRRQEFFLQHARGLCLLYRGRCREARAALEAAGRLGEAIGDRHVVQFDRVYRAEALVFEGAYAEAYRELGRLAEPGCPPRIRRMALSRLAFLGALTAREDPARQAAERHREVEGARTIPFLDAWDDLYLGWALSLLGAPDEGWARLEPAEKFFRGRGLEPAAALAACARAEGLLLCGEPGRALRLIEAIDLRGNDLTAAIRPLLSARLLLEAESGAAPARCADLLADAGAAMLANPLPEWGARLDALRAALSGDSRALAAVEERRREMARELPVEARPAYLEGRHWRTWAGGFRQPAAGARVRARGAARARGDGDRTAPLGGLDRRVEGGAAPRDCLVARSPGMRRLLEALDRLRSSELPVLIQGETGAGKELIARVIHDESRRSGGAYRVVDCAAIPENLVEAELFGARAGAFTDQKEDRPGILARALGGTALIDGLAEVPLEVQAKLLRVLSEGTARPLGSDAPERIDVRFIFSSARDLETEVREGRFRPDLFHRINIISLRVPPLRERPEDIPGLVERFLGEGAGPRPALEAGVLERLGALPWPGNVRELRNLLSRLRLENSRRITVEALERARTDPGTGNLFPRNLLAGGDLPALQGRLERDFIIHHFRRLGGDIQGLCSFLGLGRRQFYRRCERLGIRLRAERRKFSSR